MGQAGQTGATLAFGGGDRGTVQGRILLSSYIIFIYKNPEPVKKKNECEFALQIRHHQKYR
jgi:hypothetical protein